MKKLFVILSMMMLTASAFAYDFSAVCESGQTLYYSYVSNSEVKVVHPSTNWNGYTQPTGHLIIPETVENEGVVYTVISIGYHAFYQYDVCFYGSRRELRSNFLKSVRICGYDHRRRAFCERRGVYKNGIYAENFRLG